MKGKKFLKITGILMIIGGAIGIVGGVLAVLGAGALAALLEVSATGLLLSSILILVSAILQFIAGIMGVKHCENPAKAQSCFIIGILVALCSVAGNVISAVLSDTFNFMNLITGLIIPVLYIYGAMQNKKEA